VLHAADVLHGAPESMRINNFTQVAGVPDRAAAAATAEEPVA
jgi:hypothetical protein